MTTVTLQHERNTKGTHFYATAKEGAPIKSVYIAKGTFKGDAPAQITLTIEAVEE
jgi:hypothetical protein